MKTVIMLLMSLSVPCIVFAECKEYKMVDHGDRVEAVCVGTPLTYSQKQELEKQKDMERQAERYERQLQLEREKYQQLEQRILQQERRQLTSPTPPDKKYSTFTLPIGANPTPPFSTLPTTVNSDIADIGTVVVESVEVKYIPQADLKPGSPLKGTNGEYSIKLVARNVGRAGGVNFKIKQEDNTYFETEAIHLYDRFDRNQRKTITHHVQPAEVPFIQPDNKWVAEAEKQ